MVTIAATHSATPSLQSTLNKTRLIQARQQADQAEAKAQDLRTQADDAEREAQQSQSRVRELSTRQRTTDPTYAAKPRESRSEDAQKAQDFLVDLYSAAAPDRAAQDNALKVDAQSPPVKNTQGQFTGRILDLKA